jgi:hypothetical protein
MKSIKKSVMSDIGILKNLGIKWQSVEINGREVFIDPLRGYEQFIPYYSWNHVVMLMKTARVNLYRSRRQATVKELNTWLREDNPGHNDFSLNFKRTTGEFGNPFRFTACSRFYDRYTQVLVLDRTRKFWIFASHDDWMYKGFILYAAMPALGLSADEAFTYLMPVFHLQVYKELLYDETQSHRPFEGDIVNCHSINELPSSIQQVARENAVDAFNRIGRQRLLDNDYFTPVAVPEMEAGNGRVELIVKDDSWAGSDEMKREFTEKKLHIVCAADKTNPVLASELSLNIGEEAVEKAVYFVNNATQTCTLSPRANLTIMPLGVCSYRNSFNGRGLSDWLKSAFKINNDLIKCDTIYFSLRPDWSDSGTDYSDAGDTIYFLRKWILFNEISDKYVKRIIIHPARYFSKWSGEPFEDEPDTSEA